MSENVDDMKANKCLLIKNLLDKDLCKFLSVQAELDELSRDRVNSNQVPGSLEIYDAAASRITNVIVLEKLREFLKLNTIFSTYSFYRKYYKYQELVKHTDRPECELSVSVCLDMCDKKEPWEIFFENEEQKITYSAKPMIGDAVIYLGMELPHWREKCDQKWLKQLFLHYTFNKELEFDLGKIENKENVKLTKTLIKVLMEQN